MTATVTWEKFVQFDGHAEPAYDAAVSLKAFVEPIGLSMPLGSEAIRKPDGTIADPKYLLLFDGDDANARAFSLYDRFTLPTIVGSSTIALQPLRIATMFGPPFDNQHPWLIVVTL